jgi:hypothetical protein
MLNVNNLLECIPFDTSESIAIGTHKDPTVKDICVGYRNVALDSLHQFRQFRTGMQAKAISDNDQQLTMWHAVMIKLQLTRGAFGQRGSVAGSWSQVSGSGKGGEGRDSHQLRDEGKGDKTRQERNSTRAEDSINCLLSTCGAGYILWAMRRPCGTVRKQTWLCATVS